MAQAANTFDVYDGIGIREELSDAIYNVDPTETPFLSMSGRKKASNHFTEWQIDTLRAPDGGNAHVTGDEFAGSDRAPTVRVGNYCQISRIDIVVDGRIDVVSKAGRRQEMAYQLSKASKEIKRDQETISTGNQASLAGDNATPGTAGSLRAWLTTNTNFGAGGANAGFAAGVVGAATDGTDRALSIGDLNTLIKDVYVSGGNPSYIMVGPGVKTGISDFLFSTNARIATPYRDEQGTGQATAIAGMDVYVSNFGTLKIVPNRFQREDDVYVLDMKYWEFAYLRSYRVLNMGKTGDSTKRILLADWTLCSKNEKASGVVADIDETAAVTA